MGFRDVYTDGIASIRDVEWDEVLVYRLTILNLTDNWMLSDRETLLTEEQNIELVTIRQALRDITDYDTANEAADNLPTIPVWIYNTRQVI